MGRKEYFYSPKGVLPRLRITQLAGYATARLLLSDLLDRVVGNRRGEALHLHREGCTKRDGSVCGRCVEDRNNRSESRWVLVNDLPDTHPGRFNPSWRPGPGRMPVDR